MGADKVELRVDITPELAGRIDAILMVDGLKARADYVVPLLEKAIERELHRASVLLRCAGINPMASSANGKTGEEG